MRESWSQSDRGRPLLTADEVRRLDQRTAIVLRPGADPLQVHRIDYRRDREFSGLYGANPMHELAG